MACECIYCETCKGTGDVWEYEWYEDGEDELMSCPECRGEGVVFLCDECAEAEREEREKEKGNV